MLDVRSKAFRGELVPQDRNDEPADKLLTKIQAQRNPEQAENFRTKKS